MTTDAIATLRAALSDATRMADRWAGLAEKAGAALAGAVAEIARLRAREAAPRWWCLPCEMLNVGGDTCATCGKPKTVRSALAAKGGA